MWLYKWSSVIEKRKVHTPSEKFKINPLLVGWLEKAMAPHSSTLVWKIPWTEKPGRLQTMGLRRVGHDRATSLSLFAFMHWRRKWQPTPVFLPRESQGWGPPSLGSHRVGHDWSNLAAAAAVGWLCLPPHPQMRQGCHDKVPTSQDPKAIHLNSGKHI